MATAALESRGVWSRARCEAILDELITKSDIAHVLERERRGENTFGTSEGYESTKSNVLRTLGYFAQIASCRVKTIAGDYRGALAALDAIDLDKPGMFTKVPHAYISKSYYVGFSYFMSKRYTDATRHLNEGLQFIDRLKNGASRPHALNVMTKKQDQMYALLAIISALLPGRQHLLDDSIALMLHQKYSDKISRMTQGESSEYEELFSFSCPKFIGGIDNAEAYNLQLKAFLQVIDAHSVVPKLRNHLKTYSSIKLSKLAALMEVSESDLIENLRKFEELNTVKEWNGGSSALDGEDVYCGDIRVDVEGDVVKVVECNKRKTAKVFFEETNRKLALQLEELVTAKEMLIKPSAILGI